MGTAEDTGAVMKSRGSNSARTASFRKWAGFIAAILASVGGTYGITLLLPAPEAKGVFPAVAAVAVVLARVAAHLWGRRVGPSHARKITFVSVVALVLALAASWLYLARREAWVSSCFSREVVIGDELTKAGEKYFKVRPEATPRDVLQDNACQAEDIWVADGISTHRRLLMLLYAALLFPIIFATAFAWYVTSTLDESASAGRESDQSAEKEPSPATSAKERARGR